MIIESIVKNEAIFSEIARLISVSKREVILFAFIFDSTEKDFSITQIIDNINQAIQRGVRVNILLSMSRFIMSSTQKRLANSFINKLDISPNLLVYEYRHSLFNTMHSKACVVDNKYSLIFGANIQSFITKCGWKDVGVVIRDKSVTETIKTHFKSLKKQSTKIDTGKSYPNIDLSDSADSADSVDSATSNIIPIEEDIYGRIVFHSTCALCLRNVRKTELIESIHDMLRSARREICIITPNFGDTRIFGILKEQATRVRIRVITVLEKSEKHYKLLSMTTNQKAFFKYGRDFEFRFSNRRQCTTVGRNCKKCTTMNDVANRGELLDVNHSKYISVDGGEIVMIGSSNLEPFSMTYSSEMNIQLWPKRTDNRIAFQKIFEDFWDESAVL